MNEADLKRDLVATILKEGGYGRRLEDKFAVGTLDLLLMTMHNVIYAEVKMLKNIAALPASVVQRREIDRFNGVCNMRAHAIVIGYRPFGSGYPGGSLGFGLPGTRWDDKYTCRWPLSDGENVLTFSEVLDRAVAQIFGTRIREVA